MAGRRLAVAQHEELTEVAHRLRERLTARLYARRPDADEHTWSSFTRVVRGMLRDGESVEAVEPSLLEASDGL